MTLRLKIDPDTQEAREEVFMAVAKNIERSIPKNYSLPPNGRIEFEFVPIPEKRSIVIVSFDRSNLYAPYMDVFEKAISETRSGIRFTLSEE